MNFILRFFVFIFCLILSGVIFASEKENPSELRIVTLAPSLTEVVYALGLGSSLVGDTFQCDFPKEAQSVLKIGDYVSPNLERILKQKPTVVLATIGNPTSILNKLELSGIHVLRVQDPNSVSEIPAMIENIAKELHVRERGHLLALRISHSLQNLKDQPTNHESFLFIIQHNPVYSLSNKTWIASLFLTAGYQNVVGNSTVSYPILSNEYLIKNPPDIVFTSSNPNYSYETNLKIEKLELKKIFLPKQVSHIKIIFLPKDVFVRPGPRVLEAINFLSEHKA